MRILIGSNGELTGIYLAKQYRKLSNEHNEDISLIGTDVRIGEYFGLKDQVFQKI